MSFPFSLMIHGGAGALEREANGPEGVKLLASIRRILEAGRAVLAGDGQALDAVATCVALLEDDPLYNAGHGSVLNERGEVEMDAGIMDGATLQAGAVAGIAGIRNPVRLARRVMAVTPHVLLAGEGAQRFAAEQGFERLPLDWFLTDQRREQLAKMRAAGVIGLDHDPPPAPRPEADKLGTVGAVARDRAGNLAAATSTGGLANKRVGRIGDSPIVGAGVYADNLTCAVSATGRGEDIMRTVLAKRIADAIELGQLDAAGAVMHGLDHFARRIKGRGGVIVIDWQGRVASGHTTPRLIHGWIEREGDSEASF
jgi:beta-aspartyl-peptidase (threonine type)